MTLTQITEKGIKDGEIVNADINASAAIAKSKLASLDIVNADINASAAIARTKLANVDLVDDTSPQLGGDLQSNGNDIDFADNDKAIFGTSGNLEIYSTGTESLIYENATGNLKIKGTNLRLADSSDNLYMFMTSGAGLEMYHNGGKKIETTSGGAQIVNGTGNAQLNIRGGSSNGTATIQFTSDDNAANNDNFRLQNGASNDFYLQNYASGSWETNIKAVGDGAVELYHNNSKIIETFEYGVIIPNATGNLGIQWGPDANNYCNIWAEYGSGDLFLAGGLKPLHPNSGFFSSYTGNFSRNAIQINAFGNSGIQFYTSDAQNVTKDAAITVKEHMRIEGDGDLRLSSDDVGTNYGFIDGWTGSTGDMVIGADQSTTGTGTSKSNLIFRSRGSEKMRMETSGKIHIGYDASSNEGNDQVNIIGSGSGITIARGTANASDNDVLGSLSFHSYINGSNAANAEAKIEAVADSGQSGSSAPTQLDFYIKKTSVSPGGSPFRTVSMKSGGDVQLYDGNLVVADGHGIDFSAAEGTSATANEDSLLDDYEEGTWTPTVQGSTGTGTANYTARVGNYVKIGRKITVSFYCVWNSFDGTGLLEIHGLPWTTYNSNLIQHAGPVMTTNLGFPSNVTYIVTHNWYGVNYFRFYGQYSGGGWDGVQVDNSAGVIGTLTYFANY